MAKDPLPWLATNVRVLLTRIAALEQALLRKPDFTFSPTAPTFFPFVPPGLHHPTPGTDAHPSKPPGLHQPACIFPVVFDDKDNDEHHEEIPVSELDDSMALRSMTLPRPSTPPSPEFEFEFSALCDFLHNVHLKTYMDEINLFFTLYEDIDDDDDDDDFGDDEEDGEVPSYAEEIACIDSYLAKRKDGDDDEDDVYDDLGVLALKDWRAWNVDMLKRQNG